MSNASFIDTNLRGAFLAKSILVNCNFANARLITAFLMNSILENSNLQNCLANGCYFNGSNLKGANLDQANIYHSDFSDCKLEGTVMTCVEINKAKFNNASYDEFTIWPASFNPDEAGCI